MKRLIDKLVGWAKDAAVNTLGWLNAIAKDKYQHFAVGAVIALAVLIVTMPLGSWGAVAAFAGIDDRRHDSGRSQGAQDRSESRHAGHPRNTRGWGRHMGGVRRDCPNCPIA